VLLILRRQSHFRHDPEKTVVTEPAAASSV
jgi:hypothetical protein